MEKSIVWFGLFLKQNMKNASTWLMLCVMLALLWIVGHIEMPDGANRTVSVCYQDSKYEREIAKLLENSTTEFSFEAAESADEVFQNVETGIAECGFVLDEDFDELIEEGKWEEIVTCYSSPFGTKTEVAKENFYAALFPIYSRWLLTATEGEIYKETNQARLEALLRKHDELIGGELIFSFEEVRIGGTVTPVGEKNSIYPLQGLVELFVLLAMLLAAGGYGQKETAQIESALFVKEKMQFRYIYVLSAGAFIAFAGFVAILLGQESRSLWTELLSVLGVWVIGAFGVLLFSKLFRNRLTYLSWVATLVICFLLLRFGVAGYIAH